MPDAVDQVHESPLATKLTLRLLWPFFLDVRDPATRTFSTFVPQDTLQTALEQDGVWKRQPALDEDYVDGSLPNTPIELFEQSRGGGYYTLASQHVFRQLRKLQFDGGGLGTVRLDLYSSHPVELFVSPQGVGIFSLSFVARRGVEPVRSLTDVREIVSRLHYGQWGTESTASRQAILERRRGRSAAGHHGLPQVFGETFTLSDVRDELVKGPLASFRLAPLHRSFFTYAVVRFPADVDFDQPQRRHQLATSLRAVQSHWHPGHAGSVTGDVDFRQAVFNRRHWAAVGQEGVAHFVADQRLDEGSGNYNRQRPRDAFHKYFVPYLIAALQRLTVLHLTSLAADLSTRETIQGKAAQAATKEVRDAASLLRKHLLQFAVWGQVAQVQVSGVGHEFYRLSQQAMEVQATWEHARRTFGSLDAIESASEQQQLLSEINATQNKVEWIELAILGVYSIELFHALNQALGSEVEHQPWWRHLLYGATYLAVSVIAIVAAYLALGLDKHAAKHDAHAPAPDRDQTRGLDWRELVRGGRDLFGRLWRRRFLRTALVFGAAITAFNFAFAHVPWKAVHAWWRARPDTPATDSKARTDDEHAKSKQTP